MEYPKNLYTLHEDLPSLPERMKINKCTKLACTLQNKESYVIHIIALKQAIDYGLILKKVRIVIEFKREVWLKPYIDMNTKLRTQAKKQF